jgi:hypothetical protein
LGGRAPLGEPCHLKESQKKNVVAASAVDECLWQKKILDLFIQLNNMIIIKLDVQETLFSNCPPCRALNKVLKKIPDGIVMYNTIE